MTVSDPPAPTPPVEEPTEEPPPPPPWAAPKTWGGPAYEDLDPTDGVVEVRIVAEVGTHELHDGNEVEMYLYNGTFPGPRLEARVGDEVIVHFENRLPEPTTIHWHGLRISDEMDGSPRIQDPVQPGETFEYRFVVNDAGTFWYHPHVRTNEQVERGLYGAFVVHEEDAPELDLERMIVLDDVLVSGDDFAPFLASHPEIMHGRSGNVLLTNGSATVVRAEAEQGDVERWRLVNTANARTMSISIEGATFTVIGTDGGRLRAPYETDRIEMPVGQRYELELHYDREGTVQLFSHVLTLDGNDVVEVPISVLEIDVAASTKTPRLVEWAPLPAPIDRPEDDFARFRFDAVNGPSGIQWRINGEAFPDEPLFTFRRYQTVRMRLENQAGPEHPFHLHGQFFEVVNPPQPGLKDTVLVPGLETVDIIAYLDNPGRWMAHCHILEHAELGMMSEIVIE